jgi:hypothetical protein
VKRIDIRWIAVISVMLAVPELALAQTDEIQVYDGHLAEPGVFNLMLHTNFTPDGVKTPTFPGAEVADKSLNQVPEWAYGVARWFEVGLYLPLYSRDKYTGWGINGAKIRLLFAVPHAEDRRFFYGSNFEFSYNAKRWDARRFTSEIRPIIGWHLKPVDIIVNPILDTSYSGIKNVEFAPATRVAYNFSRVWATAVEEYDNFGPLRRFNPAGQQAHQLYGVVDHTGKAWELEAGIGFGLTRSSDRVVLKLMLSRDLNK